MPSGVYKRTPEHNAANSKRLRGIPHTTPAQIAADKAHSERLRGVPHTPEHNAAISASTLGIPHTTPAQLAADEAKRGIPNPHTPERIAAIKKGMEESEAIKANIEAMRCGNDLVWHHVAYDFNDTEALRVKITRKLHGKIHHPPGISLTIRGYSLID